MKTQADWRAAIAELPVFDTHTHLNKPGVPVPAQTFWDIAHYFWFQQELWSVGYPLKPNDLPEDERIARFVDAFAATRNTAWSLIVREMFRTLYSIELGDVASVRAADEAIRASAQQTDWARSVIDRLNIQRITVNNLHDCNYPELPGVGVAVPMWTACKAWVENIAQADDQRAVGEAAVEAVIEDVAKLYAQGIRGMRVDADAFEFKSQAAIQAAIHASTLPVNDASEAQIQAFLTHAILRALSEHDMFAQFFLGIQRDVSKRTAMAVNNPRRITNLYPLFERYTGGFELVAGAPQNNMDVAQAARIYPNVHAGGLWWYNFRSSTYRHAMQVRLEAVPASKSAILATDARCIEWCYGKTLLVKWLLADFLYEQVQVGWLNEGDAWWVAQEWLHDAAARRYL